MHKTIGLVGMLLLGFLAWIGMFLLEQVILGPWAQRKAKEFMAGFQRTRGKHIIDVQGRIIA